MDKEAINKLQQFLLVWYKDFKEVGFEEDNLKLKYMIEDGVASVLGAMEMLKIK